MRNTFNIVSFFQSKKKKKAIITSYKTAAATSVLHIFMLPASSSVVLSATATFCISHNLQDADQSTNTETN